MIKSHSTCHIFAKESKSSFPKCMYSNNPIDIKAYSELKKDKDVLRGVFKKAWNNCKASANINNKNKAAVILKGTSTGVKPKYESILAGSGNCDSYNYLTGMRQC